MVNVKSSDMRGRPKKVHGSEDGVKTNCGTVVGRSWRVTADVIDCPKCLGTAGGWSRTRSRVLTVIGLRRPGGTTIHASRTRHSTICGRLIEDGIRSTHRTTCLKCLERMGHEGNQTDEPEKG